MCVCGGGGWACVCGVCVCVGGWVCVCVCVCVCSFYYFLLINVFVFIFGKQSFKWRSFRKKSYILPPFHTFQIISHQRKDIKFPSSHIFLTLKHVFSSTLRSFFFKYLFVCFCLFVCLFCFFMGTRNAESTSSGGNRSFQLKIRIRHGSQVKVNNIDTVTYCTLWLSLNPS